MKIPFIKSDSPATIRVIKDKQGNTLEVPRFNSVTPREAVLLGRMFVNDIKGISQEEFELKVVTLFLNSRFGTEATNEEVMDSVPSFELLHNIFEFFYYDERGVKKVNLLESLDNESDPVGK